MSTYPATVFVSTSSTAAFNGPVCGICGTPYLGLHECTSEALGRRIQQLTDLRDAAIRREEFDRRLAAGSPTDVTVNRCPCNPANGGSGVCGCILGGSQVTC